LQTFSATAKVQIPEPPHSPPPAPGVSRSPEVEFVGWSIPQPEDGPYIPEPLAVPSSSNRETETRRGHLRRQSAASAPTVPQPVTPSGVGVSNTHTINLLIEDRRGPELENQFAEMTVSLSARPDGTPGYTVEAQQVYAQLQDGAGRIDGVFLNACSFHALIKSNRSCKGICDARQI
jgi:hypothetical protein